MAATQLPSLLFLYLLRRLVIEVGRTTMNHAVFLGVGNVVRPGAVSKPRRVNPFGSQIYLKHLKKIGRNCYLRNSISARRFQTPCVQHSTHGDTKQTRVHIKTSSGRRGLGLNPHHPTTSVPDYRRTQLSPLSKLHLSSPHHRLKPLPYHSSERSLSKPQARMVWPTDKHQSCSCEFQNLYRRSFEGGAQASGHLKSCRSGSEEDVAFVKPICRIGDYEGIAGGVRECDD